MKQRFVLFSLLILVLHKVITDCLTPRMVKYKEQPRETKGEQSGSNNGKQEKRTANSCSAHIKGIKSEAFLYYLYWRQD